MPLENNYVKQGPKVTQKNYSSFPPWNKRILYRKKLFLEKIVELCKKENINAIYLHGPLAKTILDKSGVYISNINEIISKTGITLINQVPEITYEKIGDDTNHVSNEYKKEY